MVTVSQKHLALSDTLRNDALSEALSDRGRFDSALDSAYFALLSVLAPSERDVLDHPSAEVASLAAARLGFAPIAIELLQTRYSTEQRPALEQALALADEIRARVRQLSADKSLN